MKFLYIAHGSIDFAARSFIVPENCKVTLVTLFMSKLLSRGDEIFSIEHLLNENSKTHLFNSGSICPFINLKPPLGNNIGLVKLGKNPKLEYDEKIMDIYFGNNVPTNNLQLIEKLLDNHKQVNLILYTCASYKKKFYDFFYNPPKEYSCGGLTKIKRRKDTVFSPKIELKSGEIFNFFKKENGYYFHCYDLTGSISINILSIFSPKKALKSYLKKGEKTFKKYKYDTIKLPSRHGFDLICIKIPKKDIKREFVESSNKDITNPLLIYEKFNIDEIIPYVFKNHPKLVNWLNGVLNRGFLWPEDTCKLLILQEIHKGRISMKDAIKKYPKKYTKNVS